MIVFLFSVVVYWTRTQYNNKIVRSPVADFTSKQRVRGKLFQVSKQLSRNRFSRFRGLDLPFLQIKNHQQLHVLLEASNK